MKRHTTTSYSEAKANELGVNVTRGDIPPDPPNPEGKPPTPSAATTVRAWVDHDEWYPVYSLITDRKPYFEGERIFDVPVETVERYTRLMADFDAMQNELRALSDGK